MNASIVNDESYNILPAGWGCSCPEHRSIETKEECLEVANHFVKQGYWNDNHDAVDNLPELRLFENRWKYGPCGCFVWKGGHSVYFTGDRDDLTCIAAQWAELICKKYDEHDNMKTTLVSEIADIATAYEPVERPEDSLRRCFDWHIHQLLHLKKDRNLCIALDKREQIDGSKSNRVVLKSCKGLDEMVDGFYYTQGYKLQDLYDRCLFAGKEIGSPVTFDACLGEHEKYYELQSWVYDSTGRFQNVMNGGYLAVDGCNFVENVMIVTKTLDEMNTTSCDSSQWMSYIKFNDTIDKNAIWTRVVPIYGPLLVSIVGIIITGIIQNKRQRQFNRHPPMRRPGVVNETRSMTVIDSQKIPNMVSVNNESMINGAPRGIQLREDVARDYQMRLVNDESDASSL